jgi:crotonobetainyl-CoA:carnitine CoA-transferase CaiB-like acyl-CoA transferase
VELRRELRSIFRGRTSAEWLEFGGRVNTPIAPVNTPRTLSDDPQFQARLPWLPAADLGAEQLPFPVKLVDGTITAPGRAPTLGEHTDEVLESVLDYGAEQRAQVRGAG